MRFESCRGGNFVNNNLEFNLFLTQTSYQDLKYRASVVFTTFIKLRCLSFMQIDMWTQFPLSSMEKTAVECHGGWLMLICGCTVPIITVHYHMVYHDWSGLCLLWVLPLHVNFQFRFSLCLVYSNKPTMLLLYNSQKILEGGHWSKRRPSRTQLLGLQMS